LFPESISGKIKVLSILKKNIILLAFSSKMYYLYKTGKQQKNLKILSETFCLFRNYSMFIPIVQRIWRELFVVGQYLSTNPI